jgi:hypothetical protein
VIRSTGSFSSANSTSATTRRIKSRRISRVIDRSGSRSVAKEASWQTLTPLPRLGYTSIQRSPGARPSDVDRQPGDRASLSEAGHRRD